MHKIARYRELRSCLIPDYDREWTEERAGNTAANGTDLIRSRT